MVRAAILAPGTIPGHARHGLAGLGRHGPPARAALVGSPVERVVRQPLVAVDAMEHFQLAVRAARVGAAAIGDDGLLEDGEEGLQGGDGRGNNGELQYARRENGSDDARLVRVVV